MPVKGGDAPPLFIQTNLRLMKKFVYKIGANRK
jgi:hypothetical protein